MAYLPDVLLLVEHPPVYTLGRGARKENLRFTINESGQIVGKVKVTPDLPFEVFRVERGGQVTYHGPGQLVGYPIVNLTRHKKDLRWFVSSIEATIIRMLSRFSIQVPL